MSDASTQIARALRADAERLEQLASDLRVTSIGPAMPTVREAARRLRLAAREVEEIAGLRVPAPTRP